MEDEDDADNGDDAITQRRKEQLARLQAERIMAQKIAQEKGRESEAPKTPANNDDNHRVLNHERGEEWRDWMRQRQETGLAERERRQLADRALEAEQAPKQLVYPSQIRNLRGYGVKRVYLQMLSFLALKEAFHGINNLQIPSQILAIQFPDEILSVYMGRVRLRTASLFEDRAEAIIQACYDNSFRAHPSFRKLIERCSEDFPGRQTDLIGRVASLPLEIRAAFLVAWKKPYLLSDREDREQASYHDPNIDGNSRDLYIARISSFIRRQYEKAHPK